MAIGKRARFSIFARDSFTCGYCGRRPPDVVLEVDHVHPVSQGGTDDPNNLVTACFDCNRGKADKVIADRPPVGEMSVEMRLERLEQIRAVYEIDAQERLLVDEENERLACYWFEIRGDKSHMLASDRRSNLRTFQRLMPSSEIYRAMDIAHSRKNGYDANGTTAWKYFCGVCWRMIKDAKNG